MVNLDDAIRHITIMFAELSLTDLTPRAMMFDTETSSIWVPFVLIHRDPREGTFHQISGVDGS